VLPLAQKHRYGKPCAAQKRRGSASGNRSFRGRLSTILVLVAFAAISGVAFGSATEAPGQQPPVVTTLPSISGTYREAQMLTADPGTWTGPDRDYEFQWVRCDSGGSFCDSVISATGQEYLLTAADVRSTLRIVATATNKNGSAVATSEATAVIAPALSTKGVTSTSTSTSTSSTTTSTSTPTTTTPTPPPTTTTGSTQAYFSDDFESGFGKWLKEPSNNPGLFLTVSGSSGLGAGLLTTGSSYEPAGVDGELTSLYLAASDAHAGWDKELNRPVLGQDTWYRLRVKFASCCYVATTGRWNIVEEWHDDGHTSSYGVNSIFMGVYTDYPLLSGFAGENPRLALRLAGGNTSSPTYQSIELPSNSLRYDHWYDILFHFVWHTDASVGYVQWWVDGTSWADQHFPTLYQNPDGTQSYNLFGLYNYRWSAPWNSRVDFDNAAFGPSLASVGG
jgi:hypothetical protein